MIDSKSVQEILDLASQAPPFLPLAERKWKDQLRGRLHSIWKPGSRPPTDPALLDLFLAAWRLVPTHDGLLGDICNLARQLCYEYPNQREEFLPALEEILQFQNNSTAHHPVMRVWLKTQLVLLDHDRWFPPLSEEEKIAFVYDLIDSEFRHRYADLMPCVRKYVPLLADKGAATFVYFNPHGPHPHDRYDESLLYSAVRHKQIELISYLLEMGANPNHPKTDGYGKESVLKYARKLHFKKGAEFLIEHGAVLLPEEQTQVGLPKTLFEENVENAWSIATRPDGKYAIAEIGEDPEILELMLLDVKKQKFTKLEPGSGDGSEYIDTVGVEWPDNNDQVVLTTNDGDRIVAKLDTKKGTFQLSSTEAARKINLCEARIQNDSSIMSDPVDSGPLGELKTTTLPKDWTHTGATHGGNRVVQSGKPARIPSSKEENWRCSFFFKYSFHFHAEPVIYDGLLYVPGAGDWESSKKMRPIEERSLAACLDLETGEFVWRRFRAGLNPNGQSAINEDYVVLGGVVFDRKTGEEYFDVWSQLGPEVRYGLEPVVLTQDRLLTSVCADDDSRRADWVWIDLPNRSYEILNVPEPQGPMWTVSDTKLIGIACVDRGETYLVRHLLNQRSLWSFRHPGGADRSIRIPMPIIVDEDLYVAAGIDMFNVFDLETGALKWRGEGTSEFPTAPQGLGPRRILVTDDVIILYACVRAPGKLFSTAYARGTGRLLWEHAHHYFPSDVVCIKDGIIFGVEHEPGRRDEDATHFCAWRASDGELVWRLPYPNAYHITQVVGSGDHVVYVNNYSQIFCFKTDVVL